MSSGNPGTREKILQAAWHLLEQPDGGGKGKAGDTTRQSAGQGTRMSDIARLAGVSRQALYLHFPTRTELLIATTHYIDQVKDVDARLVKSRAAASGVERLDAFIDAWGNYIPEIAGVGRTLIALQDRDDAARAAWDDRMQAVRHGCRAAVDALHADGALSAAHSRSEATDLLWTMLSLQNWDHLRHACKWPQRKYIDKMKAAARRLLVDGA